MRNLKKANYIQAGIGLLVVAAIAIAVLAGGADTGNKKNNNSTSACGPYRKDGRVLINGETINTEVGRNAAEFEKGLAGRPCILPDQGMFFAFKRPGQYRFWMKGMKFPIDILWIGADHKVAAIEIDVDPSTYKSSNPYFINDKNHLAQFVLELQANRSRDLHITLGTPVNF